MRWHANRAGPLLRWIHESNRLSGRREIAKAYPCDRDRAIVRPVLRSFWQPRLVEDGQRRSKWPDRPPSVCACMGKLSTRLFCVLFYIPNLCFLCFFSTNLIDTYVTVFIDVRTTLPIYLSFLSIYIFHSQIPAHMYLN